MIIGRSSINALGVVVLTAHLVEFLVPLAGHHFLRFNVGMWHSVLAQISSMFSTRHCSKEFSLQYEPRGRPMKAQVLFDFLVELTPPAEEQTNWALSWRWCRHILEGPDDFLVDFLGHLT